MCPARATALVLILCISPIYDAANIAERDSSLEKLIVMLEDMIAKGEVEKQSEAVQFAKYKVWWNGTEKSLKASIEDAGSDLETLQASITKLQKEVGQLGGKIEAANKKKTEAEKDNKAAESKRAAQHKEFVAEEKETSESLEAIGQAITVLKEEPSKVGQASSAVLLQLSEDKHLSDDTQAAFKSFLDMMNDDTSQDQAAPEASAYENQSGGIIEMLASMQETFHKNLNDLRSDEANEKQAYDLLMGNLINELAVLERMTQDLKSEQMQKMQKAAADEKERASTASSREADEESLKTGTTTWDQKKSSFEADQKMREDELTAINQAKSVLEGQEISEGKKHLKLIQTTSAAVSLLQFREGSASKMQARIWSERSRVKDFIAAQAGKLQSRNLMLLAEKLAADPFAKVKGLLQDMVEKLVTEADQDADKNAFCSTELDKSKITRTALSENVDGLSAKVENLKSEIVMFGEAITKLTTEVTEMNNSKHEAAEQWFREKAYFEIAIADAKKAQTALKNASTTLEDFYKKAALAEGYKGSDASAGVMALFEVIKSDFEKVEADSQASLASGTKEHLDMMTDFNKNHAVKSKSIEMNQQSKIKAEAELTDLENELKTTEGNLVAKNKYHEELVQKCFEKGKSYEEEAKAREAEIAALKTALQLLSA